MATILNKINKSALLISLVFLIACDVGFTQNEQFNLGFEKINKDNKMADGWIKWGMPEEYIIAVDSNVKHSGKYSVLIAPKGSRSQGSFGSCAFSIPAKYKGSEVELKGYMKFNDIKDGFVGLILRIDGENQPLQFDNMEKQNLQGSKDWKQYSIKLPLPENAKKILVAGINTSTGKLWIDDFTVLIDGKDISRAALKGPSVFKGENDHQFDFGSGIKKIPLDSFTIKNLMILGKIWGFLKYYHPSIAKGDYNWDYELFRVLPRIINCKNTLERNRVLSEWVGSLGKVEKGKKDTSSTNVKIQPDNKWICNFWNLGSDLSKQLSEIENAKRTESNYYIRLAEGVGNPIFDNEKSYKDFKYPDAGFRLLALYRYWNIINYYYPDKHLIGHNWDSILTEFIPKFINDKDSVEYTVTSLELIANIHDTHANIYGDPILEHYWGDYQAPYSVKFIEGKAVVCGFIKGYGEKNPGIDTGDIIFRINNKPVDNIIHERLPLTPASNYPTQLRNISENLFRTNDTVLTVTYSRNDKTNTSILKCYPYNPMLNMGAFQKKDTCFKLLTPDIAYIYPGNIKNEYLPKIMPACITTKGIIIDLRCYPSEFIVFTFSRFLLPSSKDFVKFSNGNIETPGLYNFTTPVAVGEDNKDYYKGKIIILVDETTQSQAEYTTMALRVAPRATVIGSTTAGADGNVSFFKLPGGIGTAISGIGVYYPDGKETQRVGIIPDIVIHPTIKGIREHRDELLEQAEALINQY